MGAFTSRNNAGVEEVDIASNNAYRYPPKMGENHDQMGNSNISPFIKLYTDLSCLVNWYFTKYLII